MSNSYIPLVKCEESGGNIKLHRKPTINIKF